MSAKILEIQNVTMRFGGLVALNDVSLELLAGEILAVIGPNGAGKSTLFNVITGIYKPTVGRVYVDGVDVTSRPTHEIVAIGVARTFQSSRLFSGLSVLDNVILGMHARSRPSVFRALLMRKHTKREMADAAKRATAILESVGGDVFEQRHRSADQLAQADRRRLEIARALAAGPKVLLLDEPTAGMDDRETDALIADIRAIKAKRPELSIILVEHDMRLVAALPERVAVLDYGRKIADSVFQEIQRDPRVQEAYLGSARNHD
jgi:branched-chain amino acid transport system ATP-binding protein